MAFEHVSASSIKLFESCPRRWHYRYILGRKESTSPSMELGSAVHAVLEDFLRTGVFQGEGIPLMIAKSGSALLPDPSSKDLQIEVSLDEYPLKGLPIPFKGFIDCLVLPRGEDEIPEVIDHKTTSSFRYAKTAEELTHDTQMLIYAKHILENLVEQEEIRLTHIAYLAKDPYGEARKTTVVVSRELVFQRFEKIMKTVEQMLESAQLPYNQQTKNTEYCYSYGKRCPYYSECHITLESTETEMSQKQQEVLNKLRGIKTPTESPRAAQADSPADSPANSPADEAQDFAEFEAEAQGLTVLYVDCIPVSESVQPLQTHLLPLFEQIAADHSAASLELIPYGAGWSHLLSALPARASCSATIVSQSPLYQRCAWRIYSMFDRVVIGVR